MVWWRGARRPEASENGKSFPEDEALPAAIRIFHLVI